MALVVANAGAEPSTSICVGNLPDYMSAREFRLMFKFAAGVQRCIINHTKTGRQVGYARFGTAEEAQAAIDWLNGFPLDEEFPHNAKVFMSSTQLRDPLPGTGTKRPMDPAWGGAPPPKMIKGGGKGFGFGLGGFGMRAGYGGFAMGMAPQFGGRGFGKGFGKGFGRGKGAAVTSPTSVYVGGIPHEWDEATLQSLFEGFGAITQVKLNRGTNPIGNIAFVHYATPAEAQAAIQNMNNYSLDASRVLVVRPNTARPRI